MTKFHGDVQSYKVLLFALDIFDATHPDIELDCEQHQGETLDCVGVITRTLCDCYPYITCVVYERCLPAVNEI